MIADIDAMPHDAALIQRLIDEQKLTVTALAHRSGFADQTIYGYLSGRNTLPSLVLRAAYELTGDIRVVALVTGSRPTFIACACRDCATRPTHQHEEAAPPAQTPKRTPPLPSVNELVPLAVQSVKATADALDYMTRITQDGVIDPVSDKVAIEKFNKHAADSINNLSRLIAATQPTCKEAAK